MNLKKILALSLFILFAIPQTSFAFSFKKDKEAVTVQQPHAKYPSKYDNIYLEQLKKEYKKVSNDEVILVALDMMKNTNADFSRRAILT